VLSARLVKLIEDRAKQLTAGLVKDLRNNPRTQACHKLSCQELLRRAYDVHQLLGERLGHKADDRIEANYRELGRQRQAEDVPFSEIVHALILIKSRLRNHVRIAGLVNSTVELYRQPELDCLAGQFLDKAVYYTTRSYKHAGARHQQLAVAAPWC
jgi:hypothetical protein